MTPEALADAILRASGSALRHYTTPYYRDRIIAVAADAIEKIRASVASPNAMDGGDAVHAVPGVAADNQETSR